MSQDIVTSPMTLLYERQEQRILEAKAHAFGLDGQWSSPFHVRSPHPFHPRRLPPEKKAWKAEEIERKK